MVHSSMFLPSYLGTAVQIGHQISVALQCRCLGHWKHPPVASVHWPYPLDFCCLSVCYQLVGLCKLHHGLTELWHVWFQQRIWCCWLCSSWRVLWVSVVVHTWCWSWPRCCWSCHGEGSGCASMACGAVCMGDTCNGGNPCNRVDMHHLHWHLWPFASSLWPIGQWGTTAIFGKVTGICGICMAVAGREGSWKNNCLSCQCLGCIWHVALTATNTGAPFCACLSAFLLALQFSVECLPFLQNVQLYSAVTDATVQYLVPWFFTFAVLAGDLGMTPVHGVILPSTFPTRLNIRLLEVVLGTRMLLVLATLVICERGVLAGEAVGTVGFTVLDG